MSLTESVSLKGMTARMKTTRVPGAAATTQGSSSSSIEPQAAGAMLMTKQAPLGPQLGMYMAGGTNMTNPMSNMMTSPAGAHMGMTNGVASKAVAAPFGTGRQPAPDSSTMGHDAGSSANKRDTDGSSMGHLRKGLVVAAVEAAAAAKAAAANNMSVKAHALGASVLKS